MQSAIENYMGKQYNTYITMVYLIKTMLEIDMKPKKLTMKT